MNLCLMPQIIVSTAFLSKPLVLLAEDDEDDRDLMLDFFCFNDWQGQCFADGAKLMQALAGCQPQVILLDYHMPILKGIEILRLLKADAKYTAIPVMIYSSEMNETMETKLLAAGAAACFRKPNSVSDLELMAVTMTCLIERRGATSCKRFVPAC